MAHKEVKMIKKILPLVFVVLLVTAFNVYSQVVDNPLYDNPGKSNFGNLESTGLDATGNPGYIALKAWNNAGQETVWYLWVDVLTGDANGILYIASDVTLRAITSFPTGDWRTGVAESAGTQRVGAQ